VSKYDPAFNIFQNSSNYIVAFNNYTLNSDSRQVNVSGEVKTRDSRTFTLIANLIDSLEDSPLFTNLNYTTFAKSYDQEGSIYSSSLNLSFQLEAN
jgi:hypothetical protein